ncbi:hypothetical protein EW145_g5714 [Phellinidium pouzarii]|uniref:Uncharacterized protein n=1 Tax=Phellinidium pouzarii TaxID=167371 RepID=A0A4S4L3T9_9AGAM|nr:hypothetical protein EW145_g5714 [Phellinidium pouzarii]
MAPPALLSRALDPVLGVFTGALAFYLHEANPRTAPPPGESLRELARWKRAKLAAQREKAVSVPEDEPQLQAGIAELLRDGEGGNSKRQQA